MQEELLTTRQYIESCPPPTAHIFALKSCVKKNVPARVRKNPVKYVATICITYSTNIELSCREGLHVLHKGDPTENLRFQAGAREAPSTGAFPLPRKGAKSRQTYDIRTAIYGGERPSSSVDHNFLSILPCHTQTRRRERGFSAPAYLSCTREATESRERRHLEQPPPPQYTHTHHTTTHDARATAHLLLSLYCCVWSSLEALSVRNTCKISRAILVCVYYYWCTTVPNGQQTAPRFKNANTQKEKKKTRRPHHSSVARLYYCCCRSSCKVC